MMPPKAQAAYDALGRIEAAFTDVRALIKADGEAGLSPITARAGYDALRELAAFFADDGKLAIAEAEGERARLDGERAERETASAKAKSVQRWLTTEPAQRPKGAPKAVRDKLPPPTKPPEPPKQKPRDKRTKYEKLRPLHSLPRSEQEAITLAAKYGAPDGWWRRPGNGDVVQCNGVMR